MSEHAFEVTDQVLRGSGSRYLDDERLLAIWRIICEENDSQVHLVSEVERDRWMDMRSHIDSRLTSGEDVQHVLIPVIKAISGTIIEGASRQGYEGTSYEGMFHGRVG